MKKKEASLRNVIKTIPKEVYKWKIRDYLVRWPTVDIIVGKSSVEVLGVWRFMLPLWFNVESIYSNAYQSNINKRIAEKRYLLLWGHCHYQKEIHKKIKIIN